MLSRARRLFAWDIPRAAREMRLDESTIRKWLHRGSARLNSRSALAVERLKARCEKAEASS